MLESVKCCRNEGKLPDEQREALGKGIAPRIWFILLALVSEFGIYPTSTEVREVPRYFFG